MEKNLMILNINCLRNKMQRKDRNLWQNLKKLEEIQLIINQNSQDHHMLVIIQAINILLNMQILGHQVQIFLLPNKLHQVKVLH
jgi:hypothetical protein